MTDRETYEDPGLARRFRAWVDEAAPPAAPERIVFAVMDAVERTEPARLGRQQRPVRFIAGVAQYAALTLVIAIGVAVGILATRPAPAVGPSATPLPSATSATMSPGPAPSLALGARYQLDVTALTGSDQALWVTTRDGRLVELDASTGGQRVIASLDFQPTQVAVAGGFAWLVAPGHDLERIELQTGEVLTTPSSAAARIVATLDTVWLGTSGRIFALDARDPTVRLGDHQMPGHRDVDPLLVVGTQLWVGTNTSIVRLDAATGAQVGSLAGDATSLAFAGNAVWATRGVELLRIDPPSGSITYIEGMPVAMDLAVSGNRLWLAGPPGARRGELVEVDLVSGAVLSRTSIESSLVGLAVAGGDVWVAGDQPGPIWRFSPTP
jgi:hypothetical protein